MRRLREYWKTLSFSGKLKLSYVIVFMIPLLLLGGYSYYSSLSFVRVQMEEELNHTVDRVTKEMETKLYQAESSLSLVVNNYSFQEFLLQAGQLTKLETTRIADAYIGPFLYNALLSNYNIDKLQIYTTTEFYVLTDLIKSANTVQETGWYREALLSGSYLWQEEEGRLFVSKSIRNSITGEVSGVARMRIKEGLFTQSFESFVTPPANITIAHDGSTFYEYHPNYADDHLYRAARTLAPLGWEVRYDFERQSMSSRSTSQLLLNVTITVSCLLLVIVMIHFLSRSLVKRIFVLTHQMQEVREGHMNIQVDTSYKDEIGSLALSFQTMMKRINQLILESYRFEITKKELEIRLLQEKINPHFLYNMLSTMNWIAIEHNQMKISQMTNDLATFYRTALNQGKNISTLKTELDNIRAYIALQQIARDDSFEVEFDVPHEWMQLTVPNFILQPLVENAIEHGIDTLREGRGIITIRGMKREAVCEIVIEDNGMELFRRFGEAKIDESLYGYGLSNVNERIRLQSNRQFGISIYASKCGTRAVLTLPLHEGQ
ncbi:histidine kinase [Paenibacillus sp. N4]|uniref:sensor histidine kinase n=1 Tax=Paenibacillus vietnamensis TaxID=2590547 RepID=UPI001CD0B4C1|nr:histidine kinase [Paenibacillus vietnamensis]MCA0755794.1 histidine kinase [Paenibacillus vietnamensis]